MYVELDDVSLGGVYGMDGQVSALKLAAARHPNTQVARLSRGSCPERETWCVAGCLHVACGVWCVVVGLIGRHSALFAEHAAGILDA